MASIRDVASAAGVSIATVSNVLNGRSERVSSETTTKVLAAVRLLRYRPTPLEQNQKAILNQNLGVMVPDLTAGPLSRHGYFRDVLDGILEVAAMNGWSLTVFVQKMWDNVGHAVRKNYDGRCDGLVFIAPQPGNEVVQTLHDRGTPLVFVGSTPWLPNISCVDIDNEAIGAEAARYLFSLGHRRLGFVGHEGEQVSSTERRHAFFSEAIKLGLSADALTWLKAPRPQPGVSEGDFPASVISEMLQPTTGLLCWNDGLSRQVIGSLEALGCRIPDEFSILSVDDSSDAVASLPHLSSFTNPLYDLGKRAAKMVIEHANEPFEYGQMVRLESNLIVRESTGPFRSARTDSRDRS